MQRTTRGAFERAASEFVNSASTWGLTVSIQKTKGLIVGKHVTTMPVQVGDDSIEGSWVEKLSGLPRSNRTSTVPRGSTRFHLTYRNSPV